MRTAYFLTLCFTTLALAPGMVAGQTQPASEDKFTGTVSLTNYRDGGQEREVSLAFKKGKLTQCDIVKSSGNPEEDRGTCQKVKDCAEQFPDSITAVRECIFSDQADLRSARASDNADGMARRQMITSPPIQFEKPVGPAITLYHDCLSSRIQAGAKLDMVGYRGVLAECQEVRSQALQMGDRALSKESGWSSKDDRLASVNKSLDQTEASILFLFAAVPGATTQESPNAPNQ